MIVAGEAPPQIQVQVKCYQASPGDWKEIAELPLSEPSEGVAELFVDDLHGLNPTNLDNWHKKRLEDCARPVQTCLSNMWAWRSDEVYFRIDLRRRRHKDPPIDKPAAANNARLPGSGRGESEKVGAGVVWCSPGFCSTRVVSTTGSWDTATAESRNRRPCCPAQVNRADAGGGHGSHSQVDQIVARIENRAKAGHFGLLAWSEQGNGIVIGRQIAEAVGAVLGRDGSLLQFAACRGQREDGLADSPIAGITNAVAIFVVIDDSREDPSPAGRGRDSQIPMFGRSRKSREGGR